MKNLATTASAAIIAILFAIAPVYAGPCEMSLLEKFFPTEHTDFNATHLIGGCKISGNPPDLKTVQQAIEPVEQNYTATKDHNFTIYAKTLKQEILARQPNAVFELWLLDYPTQTLIVPTGFNLTAGQTIMIIERDNIVVNGQRMNVYGIDNINPKWTGLTKRIERNAAVNADNIDEVVQRLSSGKANFIKVIA